MAGHVPTLGDILRKSKVRRYSGVLFALLESVSRARQTGAACQRLFLLRKFDFLSRLYWPLLLILCVSFAWRPLGGGYDFFAHAAVGRWIWNHGQVPTHGLFLWSAPGFPWVAHSWLCQLFFYGLIQLGGAYAVIVFTVACVCLAWFLIWRMWAQRGDVTFVTPLIFGLAIWCSAPRFVPRQELLTALLLICVLAYLLAWNDARIGSETESWRSPPVLESSSFGIVAIFALWVNLHALVLLGLIFLVATAVCDAIQDRFDRRSRLLLVIAFLCVMATLLNPFGIGYWKAADVLKSGSQASFVDEWKPFWVEPRMHWKFAVGELVLALGGLFAWLRNPNRRWSQLLWLLLMSAAFVKSRRFLWLSAITFVIVMAANARSFDSLDWWTRWRNLTRQPQLLGIPRPIRFVAHAGAIGILVLLIARTLSTEARGGQALWPPRAISRHAPVRVAQIIKERRLPGRIFNDYENSSYLQWSLNGADAKGRVPARGLHPLYIDLLNAYPDAVMKSEKLPDYFDVLDANAQGIAMIEAKKINTIHLGEDHAHDHGVRNAKGKWSRPKNGLVDYLNRNRAWKKLLDNDEGILWTRRKPLK